MNIIVCIKQVPGTNDCAVDPVTGVLRRSGVEAKLNPYDLYALETAFRLREAHGGQVRVLSMGPPQAQDAVREACFMGADDGVLLSDKSFGGADVLATSYTLSQGILAMGNFDLILCGKQTTDGDTAQVGPELAEWLGIPSVSNVSCVVETEHSGVTVEMDMGQDVEISRVEFPCLLCVEKDIYTPRLPSYRRKKAMRETSVQTLALADIADRNPSHYGLDGSPTQVQRIFSPERPVRQNLWHADAPVLAERLHNHLRAMKIL